MDESDIKSGSVGLCRSRRTRQPPPCLDTHLRGFTWLYVRVARPSSSSFFFHTPSRSLVCVVKCRSQAKTERLHRYVLCASKTHQPYVGATCQGSAIFGGGLSPGPTIAARNGRKILFIPYGSGLAWQPFAACSKHSKIKSPESRPTESSTSSLATRHQHDPSRGSQHTHALLGRGPNGPLAKNSGVPQDTDQFVVRVGTFGHQTGRA